MKKVSRVGNASSSCSVVRNIRYGECQKNHAASIGGYAVDGCREFMANGREGTSGALTCAACGCHRNFHRRQDHSEVVCEYSPPPNSNSAHWWLMSDDPQSSIHTYIYIESGICVSSSGYIHICDWSNIFFFLFGFLSVDLPDRRTSILDFLFVLWIYVKLIIRVCFGMLSEWSVLLSSFFFSFLFFFFNVVPFWFPKSSFTEPGKLSGWWSNNNQLINLISSN